MDGEALGELGPVQAFLGGIPGEGPGGGGELGPTREREGQGAGAGVLRPSGSLGGGPAFRVPGGKPLVLSLSFSPLEKMGVALARELSWSI